MVIDMKNALVSPNEKVFCLSAWDGREPVMTQIANGCRVAEVSSATFDVAPPLFWVSCDDAVTAENWYWDSQDQTIKRIPDDAPHPPLEMPADQPTSTGTQTL